MTKQEPKQRIISTKGDYSLVHFEGYSHLIIMKNEQSVGYVEVGYPKRFTVFMNIIEPGMRKLYVIDEARTRKGAFRRGIREINSKINEEKQLKRTKKKLIA